MFQLIIFDMAGTTVDEQNVVYKTVHRAIQRAGYDVSLDLVLLHAAGKEKFQAIKDVLEYVEGGAVHNDTLRTIHRDFEALLDVAYADLTPLPMPGAMRVFGQLQAKGIKVVLNTGYKRPVAELLLHKLGWTEGSTYDLLITATDVARSRPHPDMIHAAMVHFGITDPAAVVKIGDSIIDIEEGKNAGCGIAAGITTGAQTAGQLVTASPTHVLDSLDELLQLV
jgi:phosphonatase-like hydrolase